MPPLRRAASPAVRQADGAAERQSLLRLSITEIAGNDPKER